MKIWMMPVGTLADLEVAFIHPPPLKLVSMVVTCGMREGQTCQAGL